MCDGCADVGARIKAAARCHSCRRVLRDGESAWASDWTVIDATGTRTETRYTCDDCEGNER